MFKHIHDMNDNINTTRNNTTSENKQNTATRNKIKQTQQKHIQQIIQQRNTHISKPTHNITRQQHTN